MKITKTKTLVASQKQKEAKKRQALRAERTAQEQFALAGTRRGESKKERARLKRQMKEKKS